MSSSLSVKIRPSLPPVLFQTCFSLKSDLSLLEFSSYSSLKCRCHHPPAVFLSLINGRPHSPSFALLQSPSAQSHLLKTSSEYLTVSFVSMSIAIKKCTSHTSCQSSAQPASFWGSWWANLHVFCISLHCSEPVSASNLGSNYKVIL